MKRFALLCINLGVASLSVAGCGGDGDRNALLNEAVPQGAGGEAGAPLGEAPGPLYQADPAAIDRGKLVRISRADYENMVTDVLGIKIDLSRTLDRDALQPTGFRSGFDIPPALVPRYAQAADVAAAAVVDGNGPEAAKCLQGGAPTAACLDAVADTFVSRLWRRPLSMADRSPLTSASTVLPKTRLTTRATMGSSGRPVAPACS